MKFRKKPVEVDVILWDGGNKLEVEKFMGQKIDHAYTSTNDILMIPTLEGYMSANKGDLIIKGVKGEFYPCKPDIFNLTYERVIGKYICGTCKHFLSTDVDLEKIHGYCMRWQKSPVAHRKDDKECNEFLSVMENFIK